MESNELGQNRRFTCLVTETGKTICIFASTKLEIRNAAERSSVVDSTEKACGDISIFSFESGERTTHASESVREELHPISPCLAKIGARRLE